MPENNTNVDQAFGEFIDRLMQEKSLLAGGQINQPTKEELNARLDETIQRTVLEALPEEKLDELSQMLDRDISDAEMEKFFDDAGVDYAKAVERAVERFRYEYLNEGLDLNAQTEAPQVETNISTTTSDNTLNNDAAGEPVQGTTSAMPGASDVEGAEITTMTEEIQ